MKNTVRILVFMITACACQFKAAAQGTVPVLSITQLTGIPLFPPDTVYENQSASIQATITNVSNNNLVNDSVFIEMYNDSVTQQQHIVGVLSGINIVGGNSVTLTFPTYTFTSDHFKAGSNIVVVWPRAPQPGTTADSIWLNIYFVPIQGTTDIHSNESIFSVFPNPVSGFISLNNISSNSFEYVRIFDTSGRISYQSFLYHTLIETAIFRSGIYFIEIKEKNKIAVQRKFVVVR